VNLVIGIVFVVSNFVVTVFPKVTAKLVGVWLRTGQSSSQLSTARELKHDIASKLRKTAVSPVPVASKIVPDDAEEFAKEGANDDMTPATRVNDPTATTSFLLLCLILMAPPPHQLPTVNFYD
jgi:hypothetical protein